MSKAFQNEQRIVTECIKLYQAFPCLWDTRKEIHANREARDHAYALMLEKYQQLYKEATIDDLKKKIVNMRNSYRREHKRVLRGQNKGYVSTLWYYDMMTFLNQVMTFKITEEDDSDESLDPFQVIEALSQKKNRSNPSSSTLYLGGSASCDGSDVIQIKQESGSDVMEIKQESNPATPAEPLSPESPASFVSLAPFPSPTTSQRTTETESFGTSLGQHLRNLDNMQKTYAEKLISDVIYNARLKRLTFSSHVKL